MIAVEPIQEIIETTCWTGMLKDEKPLSVMLIASVGNGKSEILRKTYKAPKINTRNTQEGEIKTIEHKGSVFYTTDTTPYTLHKKYGNLLLSGQIKHIVIPDFLSILTKSKDAMPDTIRFYNSLIEEGILRIESRMSDFVAESPVQIGLITAVSSQDYDVRSQSQGWAALGFLSRVLPVSWKYKKETKVSILESIFRREYHKEKPFALNFPDKPVYVNIPNTYEKDIIKASYSIKDVSDELGARRQKQLQTFVMALALKEGRDEVDDIDMERLYYFIKFFNAKCEVEL